MNLRLTKRLRPGRAILLGALLFSAAPAIAQDDPDDEDRGWTVTVGGGAQIHPPYPGAEGVGLYPAPIISFRRAGKPIPAEAPDEGWGFGVLGSDSAFNFGPAVQFQGRRDEEDVGAAVGEVDFTVEAGAFVEAFIGDSFRLRAEGRRGFFGHEGTLGELSADFFARSGDRYIFSIGPRARFANREYMTTYFGVSPAVAGATGIPAFAPDGGLYAIGATAGLRFQLGGGFEMHGHLRYDRLRGDAADSPIVTNFGSRNQYGAGLGLSYSFNVGGGSRR
ncbi:MipA/OmpV family protein [Allosphingosinicella sp.]|jgi:outer membrane protein|uniref:MipA/OmpV family protein n=1 Tax=Allosphingosinicella sp. TaxID=2823234 RepID=UPI002F0034AC